MSFVESKPITCAVSLVLEPNRLTVVSSSPATTCAAVTTVRGAAIHAGALDPESARRFQDADDARRGRPNARQAQHLRVRRRDLRDRAAERRERVEPR